MSVYGRLGELLPAFEQLANAAETTANAYAKKVDHDIEQNVTVVINVEANAQRVVMQDRLDSVLESIAKSKRPQDV